MDCVQHSNPAWKAARSRHSGGVNALMADGSVRFVSNSINPVTWQAVGNTLFGYGAWNWLLARHPAATVTPTALLVPVFGFAASALWLGEALPSWKLAAAGLVMAGLALNVWAGRLRASTLSAPSLSR